MSGENSITLKEYFERILLEKDKAVNIALDAAKEAVQVAETNSQRWRDSSNEWRSAMNDRERNFLNRTEFLDYKESSAKALQIEKERMDISQGKAGGIKDLFGWIVAGLAVMFAVFDHFALK